MALRISKTGAVYYDDPFTQKKLEAGPQHELPAAFGSTDAVPPMDSVYSRRAGKVMAEDAAKKASFRRAKRKE
jgi:hypothetical protein